MRSNTPARDVASSSRRPRPRSDPRLWLRTMARVCRRPNCHDCRSASTASTGCARSRATVWAWRSSRRSPHCTAVGCSSRMWHPACALRWCCRRRRSERCGRQASRWRHELRLAAFHSVIIKKAYGNPGCGSLAGDAQPARKSPIMHPALRAPFDRAAPAMAPLAPAFAAALLVSLAACSSPTAPQSANVTPTLNSIELTAPQLRSVTVAAAEPRSFAIEPAAVGVIDFNEDRAVQISSPYQGRVVRLAASAGDRVRHGQLLFTIDSPDLVQAESTLITAAGALELNNRALERAKGLYAIQGLAQKDYEQVVSDQQAAEGGYRAARDALRIFGKSDADMDRIVQQRSIERQMPVTSPIDGVVTARNAAEGMLVQPGSSPAPFAVADVASKWMLADVPESEAPSLALGQSVAVKVLAFPDRTFQGRISNIAEAVDPNTHRVRVRSEISDPHDELRAQMFASFIVRVGELRALAVPYDAVVREGDGTMTVWVTTDRHRFQRRTVRVGQQQDGYDQILEGLQRSEE